MFSLDHGADALLQDADGETALHKAMKMVRKKKQTNKDREKERESASIQYINN